MGKKSKTSRYGKARSKGKRTPTNRDSKNIYGTKIKDDKVAFTHLVEVKSEMKEMSADFAKMPADILSCFLVDNAVDLGWKIDLDYIMKDNEEILNDIKSRPRENQESIRKEMDLFWRKLLKPHVNKMFKRNRSRLNEVAGQITKNLVFVEGLERKQSTLNIPDMLGVFATKKYKKGDVLTTYGVHYMVSPIWGMQENNPAGLGVPVPSGGEAFEEEYTPPTRCGMWFDDNLFDKEQIDKDYNKDEKSAVLKYIAGYAPYALDLTGVGSVYGDPRPELNQNSKYWGHLLNDGIYRKGMTKEEYNTHGQFGTNYNSKWDGLDIVATKDIDCDEELFLSYGAKYWFGSDKLSESRDHDVRKGISFEYANNLLPINKNAKPVVPINPNKGIYGKISDMKEEFLLKNQTKEGYEFMMSMMKTVASRCE